MRVMLPGLVALALALPCLTQAEALPLTLDDALSRALSENAQMSVRAAELAAARAEAKAAGRPEPITLSLSPTTVWDAFEAAISSVLDIGGRRKWASRAARHEVAAMVAGNEEFSLELAAAVRSSYWRVRVGRERVLLAEEQVKLARDIHSAAERLAEAGVALGIDRDRAAGEVAASELDSRIAQAELRRAQTELAGLLYLPPETEIEAIDELPAAPGVFDGELQEVALQARPAMLRVGALAKAAMAKAGIAGAEAHPSLEVGVEREEGINFGRALLELPLIDFGTIKHGKRAAKARAQAALVEVNVVEAEIRGEVQAGADDLSAATDAEARLSDQLLPGQRDILSRLTRGYEARTVSYLDVLEAQGALQELQSQWLDSMLDRLDAEVRLSRALGVPLEEADNADRNE